jgi:hypothetical protein
MNVFTFDDLLSQEWFALFKISDKYNNSNFNTFIFRLLAYIIVLNLDY